MALLYRNIENKYQNVNISTNDGPAGIQGLLKEATSSTKHATALEV